MRCVSQHHSHGVATDGRQNKDTTTIRTTHTHLEQPSHWRCAAITRGPKQARALARGRYVSLARRLVAEAGLRLPAGINNCWHTDREALAQNVANSTKNTYRVFDRACGPTCGRCCRFETSDSALPSRTLPRSNQPILNAKPIKCNPSSPLTPENRKQDTKLPPSRGWGCHPPPSLPPPRPLNIFIKLNPLICLPDRFRELVSNGRRIRHTTHRLYVATY